MTLHLNEVIPIGRSLADYKAMFNLSKEDTNKKILDCASGPSSFNAEMASQGIKNITSVDPIYKLSKNEIKENFEKSFLNIEKQNNHKAKDRVWNYYKNPEELKKSRFKSTELFINDYDKGKKERRYLESKLPKLSSFKNSEFDLALCSHFLFLYSNLLSNKFHLDSIKELCRISKEVRIFPINTLANKTSPHLQKITNHFNNLGLTVTKEKVQYELQKNNNIMLSLVKS